MMKKLIITTCMALLVTLNVGAMMLELPESMPKEAQNAYWKLYGERNKVAEPTGQQGDMIFPDKWEAWKKKTPEERKPVEDKLKEIDAQLSKMLAQYR